MEVSSTFILSLFFCCTIAQTISNVTTTGSAVTKFTVLPSTVKSTTVPPSKATPKPLPQSTVLPSEVTPTTVPSSTATPSTVLPSKATLTTIPPSTATPSTVPQSKATPTTVPPSKATPTTVPPSKVTLTTVPPSKSTPTTVPPYKVTPSTVPTSKATSTTVPPSKVTQSTVPPSKVTPSTVPPTKAAQTIVPPSTTTPKTVPAKRALILEFKCAANGYITDIVGVDKRDVVLLNGSNYCHLNEPNCDWKNKTKLNVLHVKGEKSSNIAGGKNAHFYQLECKTAGAFVASANTSMNIAIPAPTDFTQEIKKPTEPTKTIKLAITDKKGTPATKVHIGDPLLLKLTGPAGYTIEPISCAASSSLDKDYVLWTNKSCSSKDTAVIEDDWKHNTTIPNMVSISMYGFCFVKSNTVVVTCSALFCPIGVQCSANPCVNGKPTVSSRRRRNADQKSKNVYLQESVSTSFTVVDNRIDTSGCSGSFVSVFTYVTACALLLALK